MVYLRVSTRKKNQGKEDRESWNVARESLSENVAFEQRPKGGLGSIVD